MKDAPRKGLIIATFVEWFKTATLRKVNVNEVIRAVLNPLFFSRKDFTRTKSTKSTKKHQKHKDATKQKHKNANNQISDFFPLRCFL